jgi:hypothetical protein
VDPGSVERRLAGVDPGSEERGPQRWIQIWGKRRLAGVDPGSGERGGTIVGFTLKFMVNFKNVFKIPEFDVQFQTFLQIRGGSPLGSTPVVSTEPYNHFLEII